jgi:hypothetical protein
MKKINAIPKAPTKMRKASICTEMKSVITVATDNGMDRRTILVDGLSNEKVPYRDTADDGIG